MLPPGLPLKQWVTMSPGSSISRISSRIGGGSPTCTISGSLRIRATFFATLTGVMPQEPRMTWLARTLMPTDHVAVGLDAGERALDVDRADVDQLADPVAGDEADRADVQEGEDALGAPAR